MSDQREFVIRNPDIFGVAVNHIREKAKALLAIGKAARVIVVDDEAMATDWHRRKLHAVLQRVADNAWVIDKDTGECRQYPLAVWKEYFREMFLPTETYAMPDGTTRSYRQSTEQLSAKEKSDLILKIEAYAVTELDLDMHYEPA